MSRANWYGYEEREEEKEGEEGKVGEKELRCGRGQKASQSFCTPTIEAWNADYMYIKF